LPGRAARQLPDQSTTFRMESSSTDGSRLRGAQGTGGPMELLGRICGMRGSRDPRNTVALKQDGEVIDHTLR
jgi:hypothetical protein